MKSPITKRSIAPTFALLLIGLISALGQNDWVEERPNWFCDGTCDSFLLIDRSKYTADDVRLFREKHEKMQIELFLIDWRTTSEWDGRYFTIDFGSVGISTLAVARGVGYTDTYYDTCYPELKYLDYGSVVDEGPYLELTRQRSEDSRRAARSKRYVKIRWNDLRILVSEDSIKEFGERAAGVYVPPLDRDVIADIWFKGELPETFTGQPLFPREYSAFRRNRIRTKITSVISRESVKDFEISGSYFESGVVYAVSVGAGSRQGLKAGMKFLVSSGGDTLFIQNVRTDSADAIVPRWLDNDGRESCRADTGEAKPCARISAGQLIQTKIADFGF